MSVMPNAAAYLAMLAEETNKTEAEIIAMAFETGLRQLWRERALGRYLCGQLSRNEAIEAVGIDWVDLADRQHAAMRDDLAWALGT